MKSIKELEGEIQTLFRKREEVVKKIRAKRSEIELAVAREKVGKMTKGEIDTLRQVISETGGIKSEEKVVGMK